VSLRRKKKTRKYLRFLFGLRQLNLGKKEGKESKKKGGGGRKKRRGGNLFGNLRRVRHQTKEQQNRRGGVCLYRRATRTPIEPSKERAVVQRTKGEFFDKRRRVRERFEAPSIKRRETEGDEILKKLSGRESGQGEEEQMKRGSLLRTKEPGRLSPIGAHART